MSGRSARTWAALGIEGRLGAPELGPVARALANRYWKHFLGHGLIDPEDDMRVTNPATNPALLDALARHFVEHQFDLKDLVRTICQSAAYQLSSEPNEYNAGDKQNFSFGTSVRKRSSSLGQLQIVTS